MLIHHPTHFWFIVMIITHIEGWQWFTQAQFHLPDSCESVMMDGVGGITGESLTANWIRGEFDSQIIYCKFCLFGDTQGRSKSGTTTMQIKNKRWGGVQNDVAVLEVKQLLVFTGGGQPLD